jgi:hypothetical protein
VSPYLKTNERDVFARRIFQQLIVFTYPPWILEYRRIQSWRYAVGICLGMRPRNIFGNLRLRLLTRAYLCSLYAAVTLTGLLLPISVFETLKPRLYALAKAWK